MDDVGRNSEPPKPMDEKAPPSHADEEYDDGDIATPKSDHTGEDDKPL